MKRCRGRCFSNLDWNSRLGEKVAEVRSVDEAYQVMTVESPEPREAVEPHELCVRHPRGRKEGDNPMLGPPVCWHKSRY